MSRDLDKLQRQLLFIIKGHGKPMTFDEIRDMLTPSFERSLQRAVLQMVDAGFLISVGGGDRADPFRFFVNKTSIAMVSGSEKEADALLDALLATDPAAVEDFVQMLERIARSGAG